MLQWVLTCAVVLLLTGFFSGTEIAFFTANRFKIELRNSRGEWAAKILSYFYKNTPELIATLLITHNLMLVIYSLLMYQILDSVALSFGIDGTKLGLKYLFIQTACSTLIVLLFAEYLPKVLFKKHSEQAVLIAAPFIYLLSKILRPAILLFNLFNRKVLYKLFRIQEKKDNQIFTRKDLKYFIEENFDTDSDTEGINPEYFSNALAFNELRVREIMIPRTEIIAFPLGGSVQELGKLFRETELSRIVIYQEDLDHIVGYVHVLDIIKKPKSIKDILKNILKIPESLLAYQLLNEFNQKKKSIAIVMDEFGGTAGLVTLEDLVEAVLGDIQDEYDEEESEYLLEEPQSEPNSWLFSARHEIEYLNKKYDLELPEGEYTTLSGFIISIADKIPTAKEVIHHENLKIEIVSSSPTKIDSVKITKLT